MAGIFNYSRFQYRKFLIITFTDNRNIYSSLHFLESYNTGRATMEKLRKQIDGFLSKSGKDEKEVEAIKKKISIYPFTTEGMILVYLIAEKVITYEQFNKLHDDYIKRNKYLDVYDMAPRTFGETWCEKHILKMFPEFTKATKKNLAKCCPAFDGEFDLWLDGIRVEVKACRANRDGKKESLASRAYSYSEAKKNNFTYHFQQVKPSCCDVFICIGVCTDKLLYWVFSSKELEKFATLSTQHRNENTGKNTGKTGFFEGQIFMTEAQLHPYAVHEKDILNAVVRAH